MSAESQYTKAEARLRWQGGPVYLAVCLMRVWRDDGEDLSLSDLRKRLHNELPDLDAAEIEAAIAHVLRESANGKDGRPPPPDAPPKEQPRSGDEFDGVVSEDAAATMFAKDHKDNLRYCHTAGGWFEWNGAIWRPEKTKVAFHWARQLARAMAKGSPGKARIASGKAAFAGGVERFAQADRAFAVSGELWNSDPWLLATPGGTVDLRTGQLREAVRTDHITKLTAVAPADKADCPLWLAFLNEACRGDADLVRYLQRYFGYALCGDTREHALVFVYGPGANGKGVLLQTLYQLLGDYAATAAVDTFVETTGSKHTTDLAMLAGARLVITTEVEDGQTWAAAKIKTMTGGDPITARFMRRDNFTYLPQFKLAISGNHKPRLRNVDVATRRRIVLIPFLHVPPVIDKQLPEKLRAEWPAILRWLIDGCSEWLRIGLSPPDTVLAATNEYFEAENTFGRWLNECCDVDAERQGTPANLFKNFQQWCRDNGEEECNAKVFRGLVENHHGLRYALVDGKQWIKGISVRAAQFAPAFGTPPAPEGQSG